MISWKRASHFVFNLEEIPPERNFLGVGMVCEGVKDACKCYRMATKGEHFSWQEWTLEKAANYAAIALSPISSLFIADTITEISVEITKSLDENFGKKMEEAFRVYRKLSISLKIWV